MSLLCSAPGNPASDPVYKVGDGVGSQGARFPITSSNIVVSYKQSSRTGWHLGVMTPGGTTWKWKASPSNALGNYFDGQGSFDLTSNGGHTAVATGRNVVYTYNGEFWNGGQGNQYMHFYDNGLFVGQFGQINHPNLHTAVAGVAGNAYSPAFAVASGNTYLWNRDESNHSGIHRWKLAGLSTIGELTGNVSLGSSVTLTGTAPVGTTTLSGPTAPGGLTTVAGNGSVALTWNASSGAISYKIKRSTVSGKAWGIIATAISSTAFVDNTVTNGQTYYYEVSAWNAAGDGPDSSPKIATPGTNSGIYEAENAVHSGTIGINGDAYASNAQFVNGLGNSGATVTFNNVAGGAGGTFNMKIGYAWPGNTAIGLYANGSRVTTVNFPATANYSGPGAWGTVTVPITLVAGNNTIEIVNDVSGNINFDYIQLLTPPSPPTGITATPGNNRVTLSWTGSTGATSYKIYRGTTSNGQSATPLATVTTNTAYADTTAVGGTTNYYKISASNTNGEGVKSSEVSATALIPVPPAPTGLTATPASGQITLDWTASSGATSYKIYRGTTSNGQSGTPIATGVVGTSYVNTGLTNGTTYYYKVKATNVTGDSGNSNQASSTAGP